MQTCSVWEWWESVNMILQEGERNLNCIRNCSGYQVYLQCATLQTIPILRIYITPNTLHIPVFYRNWKIKTRKGAFTWEELKSVFTCYKCLSLTIIKLHRKFWDHHDHYEIPAASSVGLSPENRKVRSSRKWEVKASFLLSRYCAITTSFSMATEVKVQDSENPNRHWLSST